MSRNKQFVFDPIEFREEFNARHRFVSRIIYLVFFFALLLFSVWDVLVVGAEHPRMSEFVVKRYAIAFPLLFAGFILSFFTTSKIRMDWLMTLACLALGLSVIQIYILFHEIGMSPTIDGFMLFMLSIFFIPSIFAYQKVIVGLSSLLAYVFFLWVAQKELSVVVHAIIYLGLINIAGAIHGFSFDRTLKENFSSQKILRKMAHTDQLTGAHNRHKFEDDFNELLKLAMAEKACVGLYIVDIDKFKQFNDHYGHLDGDDCLVAIAHKLQSLCRYEQDRCIRFGGEEFILVKYGRTQDELYRWGNELLEGIRALQLPHEYSEVANIVTVSIGAAFINQDKVMTRAELMAKADEALYQAKEAGRNCLVIAST